MADPDALIAKARETVALMDANDRAHNFATPQEAGQTVETAMMALRAGMATEDWSCVAEAYVMLERGP